MGFLTYFWRDVEQIMFPMREQHAIPSMDGSFGPNDRLDLCSPIGEPIAGADDVVEAPDGALYVSGGHQVFRLSGEGYLDRRSFAEFEGAAGGLAWHPDGRLLVCVSGHGLAAVDRAGQQTWLRQAGDQPLNCLTGVVAAPDGQILLCNGSSRNLAEDWCRDLLEKNRLGRVVGCGPGFERPAVLLRDLAYPHGLAVAPDGRTLWFSESWSHRISHVPLQGQQIGSVTTANGNLPGYPARLARAKGGGFWLSLFAVRTHLIEFVLREDDYREEMMRTIEPRYWVGPSLTSGEDCHEPMQWGGLKALGIQKPWAPPRSYGLLAQINDEGDVVQSMHSRVGGHHHGITAACETAQGLVIVSKGSGRLLLDRSGGQR